MVLHDRRVAKKRVQNLRLDRSNTPVLYQLTQMFNLNFEQTGFDGRGAAKPPQEVGEP